MADVIKLSKKAFTWSVVLTTMLWSVGFATLAPLVAQAADECPVLEAGDRFKVNTGNAVYSLDGNLDYMYWPHASVNTQYNGEGSFGDVTTISSACFDNYSQATNPSGIVHLPGAALILQLGSSQVYAVLPGNKRAHITDGAIAEALYGSNWVSFLHGVNSFLWSDYTDAAPLTEAIPHDGMLVTTAGSSNVYYVMDQMYHMVDGALGHLSGYVHTVSQEVFDTLEMADTSVTPASITADPTQGLGGDVKTPTPGPGEESTSVSVSLSGASPSEGKAVINVPNVVFGKFVLTNSGDVDTKVNSVKIGRRGLGSDANFAGVTLYDGSTKLGNTKSSWNSDGYMTYNIANGWTIPAGTSKTLTLTAELDTAGTYNSLGIEEITLSKGTATGLAVYGAEMNGVDVTVGSVTVTGQGTASQTKNIGSTDVTLARFELELSSVEDGYFQTITLNNKGTASDNDVANLYLYHGADMIAGPVDMESDDVTFVLDEEMMLEKSESVEFKVIGDIVDGDTNTVEFVLNADTDLTVVGETYGTSLGVTRTAFDAQADSGTTATTIDGAELNVAWTSTAQDVVDDQNNVEFARLTLSSGATDIEITQFRVDIDEVDGSDSGSGAVDIDELELVDTEDGSVYSGTMASTATDANAVDENWTFADDIYLEAGVSRTFILRGDLPDNMGDGDKYRVSSTLNATYVVGETQPAGDALANDSFSIASYTGQFITVKAPYLTVTADSMNDGEAVADSMGVELYNGQLRATAGMINVERLKFGGGTSDTVTTSLDTTLDKDNFDSLSLYTKVNGSWVKQQTVNVSSLTNGEVDFDELDIDVEPGNANKVYFSLRGDIASTLDASNKTIQAQLELATARDENGDTVQSKTSGGLLISNEYVPTSRTVTLTDTGILYVSMRNNDSGYSKDRYVLAGEGAWVGKLRLKAEYEDIIIEDLKLYNTVAGANNSAEEVCLYSAPELSSDKKVACAELGTNRYVNFDNINVTVEEGNTDWYIYVQTAAMGDTAFATADTNDQFAFKISSTSEDIVARGAQSGDELSFGNNASGADEGEIVFDEDLDGNFDEANTDDETATTKNFLVVGSKITGVEFVNSYGGETVSTVLAGTGDYTVAILKITTAAHSNTDASGEALKLALGEFRFDVDHHASTTVTAVTVERIAGVTSTLSLPTPTLLESNTGASDGGSSDVSTTNVTGTNYMGEDALIEAGETAYYVVKATVGALDNTSGVVDWIRFDMDNLNAGGATANIVWTDGYSNTVFRTLRTNTDSLTGTKINENL